MSKAENGLNGFDGTKCNQQTGLDLNGRDFRIVCRRANGSVSLVCLAASLTEAVQRAKVGVRRHLEKLRVNRALILLDSSRPREVYLERWVGNLIAGSWHVVSQEMGGFAFEFLDHPPKCNKRNAVRETLLAHPEQAVSRPAKVATKADVTTGSLRSGDVVECELLPQRTRKNGWFAKLLHAAAQGPITNSCAVPADCQPGKQVWLKVCGIKLETGFAQFAWIDQPQ